MAIATQRFDYAPALDRASISTGGSLFKRVVAALKASRAEHANRIIARHMHIIERTSALAAPKPEVSRKDLPF